MRPTAYTDPTPARLVLWLDLCVRCLGEDFKGTRPPTSTQTRSLSGAVDMLLEQALIRSSDGLSGRYGEDVPGRRRAGGLIGAQWTVPGERCAQEYGPVARLTDGLGKVR